MGGELCKLKAYCPVYDLFFSLAWDQMFLSFSDFKSDPWGDCQMASYFQNLKCICIHRDGGCKWECGRVHIKLQHNYSIWELEGTSSTISAWCVQILQSWGLRDLSLVRGLPRTSDVILKSHIPRTSRSFFIKRGGSIR